MADLTAISSNAALVIVDRAPRVYALQADDEIVSWVFALPTGDAIVVDTTGRVTAYTSLDRLRARHRRRDGADIVEVVECPTELRAA